MAAGGGYRHVHRLRGGGLAEAPRHPAGRAGAGVRRQGEVSDSRGPGQQLLHRHREDYPRNRHPGGNKGDIMDCGVLFPKDFECRSDSEEEGELMARIVEDHLQVKRETGKSSRSSPD